MATIMSDLDAPLHNRGGGRTFDTTAFPEFSIATGNSDDATEGLRTLVQKFEKDGGVLLVSDVHLISGALVIPATVVTAFAPGGRFKVGSTGSVTFMAPIQAERMFIFDVAKDEAVSFAPGVQDRVFPEWWGAKGDGTTDDTSALEASLSAAGGRCLDVAGRHRFTRELTLPSDVHVVSRHRGGFVEGTTHDGKPLPHCLRASGAQNVVFDGIYLEGRGKAQDAEERGLFFTGCSNVAVRNCEIAKIAVGAYFENCTDWRFVDNYVHDIKTHTNNDEGYGVITTTSPVSEGIQGTNANWVIARNVFHDIERHAVYVSSGSSNGVVEGNVIRTCRSIGILLYATDVEPPVRNVTISGNSISDIARVNDSVTPWGIGGTGNLAGLTIVGNSISKTGSGIYFQGNGPPSPGAKRTNPVGLTIVGNTIADASTDNPNVGEGLGIAVYNVQDARIESNTVLRPNGTGILASVLDQSPESRLSRITIAGNEVMGATDSNGPPVTGNGITISGGNGASDIILGSNILRNCKRLWNITPETLNGITYDVPLLTFHFAKAKVAKSSKAIMDGPLADVSSYPTPSGKNCYIVGIAAASDATPTGTCTIKLLKDGNSAGTPTLDLPSGSQTASTSLLPGLFPWSHTERLSAQLETDKLDPADKLAVTVIVTVMMYDPD